MAAKFFTGLPLDGPDPECVLGHGEHSLAARDGAEPPKPSLDHSRRPRRTTPASGTTGQPASGERVAVALLPRRPDRACDEHPLASFDPGPPPT